MSLSTTWHSLSKPGILLRGMSFPKQRFTPAKCGICFKHPRFRQLQDLIKILRETHWQKHDKTCYGCSGMLGCMSLKITKKHIFFCRCSIQLIPMPDWWRATVPRASVAWISGDLGDQMGGMGHESLLATVCMLASPCFFGPISNKGSILNFGPNMLKCSRIVQIT